MERLKLADFTEAVQANFSIAVHSDGTWSKRWDPFGLTTFFRRFFGLEVEDTVNLARYVKRIIQSTEIISKKQTLYDPSISDLDIEKAIDAVKQRLQPQLDLEKADCNDMEFSLETHYAVKNGTQNGINLAERLKKEPSIIKKMKHRLVDCDNQIRVKKEALHRLKTNSVATKIMNKLEANFIAKKLRATPQSTIEYRVVQDEDRKWLKEQLTAWKGQQFPEMPALDEQNKPIFTADERKKIESLCKYPEAISLLKRDKNYREFLFKFVFKNTNGGCPKSADIAIQFPKLTKKLSTSYLDKRIKRLSGTIGLSLKEEIDDSTVAKDICLRIQKKEEPLRDLTRTISFVDLKNGNERVLTINDIFREFRAKKTQRMGDFEYTEDGVSLCYPKSPQLDFNKEQWWEDLPIIERLTRDEVERKYATSLDDNYALFAVRASRETDPFNTKGTHGWLQIVLPHKDGNFTVHAIGKYTDPYPQGDIETLFFSFRSHVAFLSGLDENEFHFHRDHCLVPKAITKVQTDKLLNKLKEGFQESKTGNLVFQAQGQNCSAWVQEVLDEVFGAKNIPRVFDIPMTLTNAPAPVDEVIYWIRRIDELSHQAATMVRVAIGTVMGGTQEITMKKKGQHVVHSTMNYQPWRKGILSLPALLFETQDKLKEAFAKI